MTPSSPTSAGAGMPSGARAAAILTQSAIEAGEAAELRGDYVAAAAAYKSLADSEDAGTQADGCFRLGIVAFRQSRFDAAYDLYVRARDLSQQSNRGDLEARATNGIGAVHYARGEYTQARASYRLALDLTADPCLRARFLLNLGVLANIEGDLDGALEHYLRARALFRDCRDEPSEVLALHNLQMLHSDRREWEDAEQTSAEALVLLEKIGDRATIAQVLRDRSEVLAAMGQMLEAIRHCQLATSIFTELGNEVERAESELLHGRFLRQSGLLDQAERCLVDAYRAARAFRATLAEAEACRELAALHRARGDAAETARWRARAVKLFTQLGARRELAALARGED